MRSKFSAEQISQILEESKLHGAQGEVARKYGVSPKTISNWKQRFKGMQGSDIRALKGLEEENSRLKRLVARQAYDIELLKEINSKKW
jgi:putative transposase